MQLNCKVIKKWQPPFPPFLHQPFPSFEGYPPFLAKSLVPHQVTQFLEGPTPLNKGRGGSNYVCSLHR